jgi:hypothetical protein
MADEAFALSPISARAAAPSEADYDAIREAFMETSRGRWFLNEYAKRNRNSDTRMVLDAVARIEETLAAQRKPPPADNRLPEALAAIRGALDRAEDKAARSLDGSGLEESLAPIRKGARIIKEISWRWREIGADGRICDLIDSQIAAIETGCGKIAGHDPRAALREAFEEIRAEIEAFRDNNIAAAAATPEPQATTVVVPFPPPAEHVPAASANRRDEAPRARVEVPVSAPERPLEAVAPTDDAATAEAADAEADAHDEAVLDLVAAEMSAPDVSEEDDLPIVETDDTHITPPPPPPEPVAPVPEPIIAQAMAEPVRRTAPAASVVEPLIRPTLAPAPTFARAPEPSLGSMIIAGGILPKKEPASDPLAPIRRMSQAEKIAFFS